MDTKCGVGLQFISWRSDSIKHGWLTRTDKRGQNLRVRFPVLVLQMRFHQFFERHPLSESIRVSACLSDTCRTCVSSPNINKYNTPTFDNISWEANVQNGRAKLHVFRTYTSSFIPTLHSIAISIRHQPLNSYSLPSKLINVQQNH